MSEFIKERYKRFSKFWQILEYKPHRMRIFEKRTVCNTIRLAIVDNNNNNKKIILL